MQRNYILFAVLSLLILVSWIWLERTFNPQKPPEKKQADSLEKKQPPLTPLERDAAALAAGTVGQPLFPADAFLAFERLKAFLPKQPEKIGKEEEKKGEKEPAPVTA